MIIPEGRFLHQLCRYVAARARAPAEQIFARALAWRDILCLLLFSENCCFADHGYLRQFITCPHHTPYSLLAGFSHPHYAVLPTTVHLVLASPAWQHGSARRAARYSRPFSLTPSSACTRDTFFCLTCLTNFSPLCWLGLDVRRLVWAGRLYCAVCCRALRQYITPRIIYYDVVALQRATCTLLLSFNTIPVRYFGSQFQLRRCICLYSLSLIYLAFHHTFVCCCWLPVPRRWFGVLRGTGR